MKETALILDTMAFADGRLDPPRRRTLAAEIEQRQELREIVSHIEGQNRAIRAAFGGVAEEEVPDRLARLVDPETVRPRNSRAARLLPALTAVSATLVVGVAGVWIGARADNGPDVTEALRDAAEMHDVAPLSSAEGGLPLTISEPTGAETDAGQPQIGFGLPAVLTSTAFRLVAAEPTELDGRQALRLSFEGPDDRTLSLFIATAPGDVAPVQIFDDENRRAAYWFERRVMWILTGDADTEELATLAEGVHDELLRHPGAGSRALPIPDGVVE